MLTDEDKYGDIKQPPSDDLSFDTAVDQRSTAKSSPVPYLPLIANNARSTGEGKHGVINQPQCDDIM